jgi:hypothetical protein
LKDEECRAETISRKPYGCIESHKILYLLALKMNVPLTDIEPNENEELPEGPGLHLCLVCNITDYEESMKYYSPKVHFILSKDLWFTYCKYDSDFESVKWSNLTRPFGIWIWVWIFFTFIAYSILFMNVSYGLDIIFALLFQPIQNKWKIRWMYFALLLLAILSNAYLGVVTTDLVKPLKEKQIPTLSSAVQSQYRYIVGQEEAIQFGIERVSDSIPSYRKRPVTKEYFTVLEGFEPEKLVFTNPIKVLFTLAKHHGIAAISHNLQIFQPFLEADGITIRFGNASCTYLSKDKFLNFPFYWMMRLHLSQRAYLYLNILQETGIAWWWQEVREFYAMLSALNRKNSNMTLEQLFGFIKPKPMPLIGSNLENIFILLLGMSGLSFLCLLFEVKEKCWRKIKKVWKVKKRIWIAIKTLLQKFN